MASQTEVPAPGEFIASEATGTRSRENIIIASGAGIVPAGRMLGKVTAGGKYVAMDTALANGAQAAAGILYAQVDATSADAVGVLIARDAEVVNARVTAATPAHKNATTIGQLNALGIFLR